MFVAVIGGGRVGYSIAEFFSKRGDRVVVVEKNEKVCGELARSLDVTVYCGDARSIRLLEEAGVNKADVLFAVSGSDSLNIRVASVAKKRFGVPRVVVRVNHAENKEKAAQSGADEVICLDEVAELFVRAVTEVDYRVLFKHGGFAVVEIRVPPDSPAIGKPLRELVEKGLKVVAVVRDGSLVEAGEDLVLEADDRLVLAGREEAINEARQDILG